VSSLSKAVPVASADVDEQRNGCYYAEAREQKMDLFQLATAGVGE